MKFRGKACILGLLVLSLLALGVLAAETGSQQGYLWNGSHWKDMSPELKVAYVKGIGNMADFETASGGKGRAACISKAFVDELKTKTIGQVVSEVDSYYQANPTKMSSPVIEVILRSCTKLCPPEAPATEKKKK
jgi:hypothetical protein